MINLRTGRRRRANKIRRNRIGKGRGLEVESLEPRRVLDGLGFDPDGLGGAGANTLDDVLGFQWLVDSAYNLDSNQAAATYILLDGTEGNTEPFNPANLDNLIDGVNPVPPQPIQSFGNASFRE